MKVIGGWVAAVLMVIGMGVGIVSAVALPNEARAITCDSPPTCVALAVSSSPARHLAVPVVPGAGFEEGAVVIGDGVLFGDHGTDEPPGWNVWMSYSGPGGRESLSFSANAASEQTAARSGWRSCQRSSSSVRCVLITGIPAYYLVSPGSVWLTGLHDGVFFLLQTSRPASLPVGDFGPSRTRTWLFGVMASVYGS
jgi:hypothetical protein